MTVKKKRLKDGGVICVICARGGSKGLPGKNILPLDGEPLVARAVRHAKESGVLDAIVVSTDHPDIARAARAAGAETPFTRPAELSGDLITVEETLKHALLSYEALKKRTFAIAVFLTPTDIFRDPRWIAQAVALLRRRPELESVFSGHKTHKNFWERRDDGAWERLKPWMSVYACRQVRRTVVREDTGLACASRAQLWRDGRRIGDRVEILVNDDAFTGIDIHLEEDLRLAQAALDIRKIKV